MPAFTTRWQQLSQVFFLLLLTGLSSSLSGCAEGLEQGTQKDLTTPIQGLQICKSTPAQDAKNIDLDSSIHLYTSDLIDGVSFHPTNFAIMTDSGSVVPGSPDISGRQVSFSNSTDAGGCPVNKPLNEIIIRTQQSLMPSTRYMAAWQAAPSDAAAQKNPDLLGIRSRITGESMTMGLVRFTTAAQANVTGSRAFRATSVEPGVLVSLTGKTDSSLSSLVTSNPSIIKNQPISFLLSEPMFIPSVDVDISTFDRNYLSGTLRDIPESRPIPYGRNFPELKIAVVDASFPLADLIGIATTPSRLNQFFSSNFYDQFKGVVFTSHSRRMLHFKLTEDCINDTYCGYPNNGDISSVAKVVVVVLSGVQRARDHTQLSGEVAVGAFAHISSYQLPIGFPSFKTELGRLLF